MDPNNDTTVKSAAPLLYRIGKLCELASPGIQLPASDAVAVLRKNGMFGEAEELAELVLQAEARKDKGIPRYMRDDSLGGVWDVATIDGSHVEWRRRVATADTAYLHTDFVIDISIDGGAAGTYADFNDTRKQAEELAFRVRQLKSGNQNW